MQHRTLGTTDITVPSICLGTMTFGQQNTEAEAHEQLDYAVSAGVNFIDTAEIYPIPPELDKQGRTEEYIGSWLAKRGTRDGLVIASKVATRSGAGTIRQRDASLGTTKASVREALEGSLRRLGVEYLDLYQVHYPERHANFFGVRGVSDLDGDDGVAIEETYEALSELVKEGKVRAIGVSNETPWGLNKYLSLAKETGGPRIATIQNQYSLINRTFEIGLSEIALREKVSLLPYSPLSMGVLTGKYLDGARPSGARFTLFTRNADRYNPERAQEAVAAYVAVAKKHGLDPAQMAIAFTSSQAFVASTIIGATTLQQLKTNIAAGDLVLSPEVLADIRAVYTAMPDPTH